MARRAAAIALIAATQLSLLATFPVRHAWDDGCNTHSGWVPLAELPITAVDATASLPAAYVDSQSLVLCLDG